MAGELFLLLASCIGNPRDSNAPDTTDTSDTAPIDTQETDADTDTDSDIDTDSDADADTDTDTDSDADCDSYSDISFSNIPDYTFTGSTDGVVADELGSYLSVGDTDNDGVSEIIIGAPNHQESYYGYEGALYSIDVTSVTPGEHAAADTAEMSFVGGGAGESATAQDIDGDGIKDLMFYDAGSGGTAFIRGGSLANRDYDLSRSDLSSYAGLLTGAREFTILGDINGDGTQEAVYGSGASCEIKSLDPDLLTPGTVLDWDTPETSGGLHLVTSINDETYYSSSFCDRPAAGDVNGDGINDVLWADTDSYSAAYGIVRLMYGQTDWPSAITVNGDTMTAGVDYLIFTGTQNGSGTGSSMNIRDVDGDGFGDVFLGALGHDNGTTDSGAVYFFGGQHLVSDYDSGDNIMLTTTGMDSMLGEGKIVYGAPEASSLPHALISFADEECPNLGGIAATTMAAYVFNGSTLADLPEESTVTKVADQALTVDGADAWFGDRGVSGDVNGDGVPDLIVSDYQANDGQGAVYVYEGTRE